jgi:hypothetical protein
MSVVAMQADSKTIANRRNTLIKEAGVAFMVVGGGLPDRLTTNK